MPLVIDALAVHLGTTGVDRLYLGSLRVWPIPITLRMALAGTAPATSGQLTGIVQATGDLAGATSAARGALVDGTPPLPVPRRQVLVVSAPRPAAYRPAPSQLVVAAPVAVTSTTALVDVGRVDVDTIG